MEDDDDADDFKSSSTGAGIWSGTTHTTAESVYSVHSSDDKYTRAWTGAEGPIKCPLTAQLQQCMVHTQGGFISHIDTAGDPRE